MKRLSLALLLAISFGFSGCPIAQPGPGIVITMPASPELMPCPSRPNIQGDIVVMEGKGKTVVITIAEASALVDYMSGLEICNQVNVAILKGQVQKLENRILAVGGK